MRNRDHRDPEAPADQQPLYSYARLVERLVAPGENPRHFKELYDRLVAEWQPQTVTEWMTFSIIIRCHWRVRRADTMEAWLMERIGRTVWGLRDDLTLAEALGPVSRETRAAMGPITRMRIFSEKSLVRAERSLRRTQKENRRNPKPAQSAGPKLADLEPGSNLIQ